MARVVVCFSFTIVLLCRYETISKWEQLKKKAKEDKDALGNLPKLTSFLTRASCPAPENISSASGGFSTENTTAADPGYTEVGLISNESNETLQLESIEKNQELHALNNGTGSFAGVGT